ncbi:hypothetical protein [Robertkochia solimangrovi]|uniref:hypothetical protein n=1 Tax=Robertkochia solimangrovi TaxID=2213046 RepID=UPI00117D9B85|nr:hypothetical protein [Robertkochia solimangrovi]
METYVSNSVLHFEHTIWHNELLFWEDEIKIFRNRLEQILDRWTNHAVLADLDHFQNQFEIHQAKIDSLRDAIEYHEHTLAIMTVSDPEIINVNSYKLHLNIRKRMETEREVYNDLKKQFFGYLSRYL